MTDTKFQRPASKWPKTCVIVVGGNHGWGKGATLSEARRWASRPKHYVAYLAHADTTVDSMGYLTYPGIYPPIKIDEKLPARVKGEK